MVTMYHPEGDFEWNFPENQIERAYNAGYCLNKREDFTKAEETARKEALKRERESRAFHNSKQEDIFKEKEG